MRSQSELKENKPFALHSVSTNVNANENVCAQLLNERIEFTLNDNKMNATCHAFVQLEEFFKTHSFFKILILLYAQDTK